MKHALKEIALFLGIVPALSVWLPLLLMLWLAIMQTESGLIPLIYRYAAGTWILRLFGYTNQDLTSGGDFMRLPSDLAVDGVFLIYTVMGFVVWLFVLLIRLCRSGLIEPNQTKVNLPPADW